MQAELGHSQEVPGSAFTNAQTFFVGTVQPKLCKIVDSHGLEAILLESDKPAVFYQDREKVELHYLQAAQIRNVQKVQGEKLVYTEENQMCLGKLDSLGKLQLSRVLFKK